MSIYSPAIIKNEVAINELSTHSRLIARGIITATYSETPPPDIIRKYKTGPATTTTILIKPINNNRPMILFLRLVGAIN